MEKKTAYLHLFSALSLVTALAVTGCDSTSSENPKAPSVEEQLNTAKVELENKNYGKTIEITVKITQSDPKNVEAYYLESQAQALAGSLEEAIRSLENALENGFRDFEGLIKNKNLDALKSTPEFELLMQRFNPDAAADAAISSNKVTAGDTSITEENGQQVIKAGDVEIRIPK